MSDDSTRTPPEAGEDAFSRAFRERWGNLADRAERLDPDAGADADPTNAAPPPRDPTAALPTADTEHLPVTPEPEATAPVPPAPPPSSPAADSGPARQQPTPSYGAPTGQPSPTYDTPSGRPQPSYGSAPPPPQPGDPYPSYGPRAGEPYPAYGHHPHAAPSAAALLIVSGVTMALTMLTIGLPSLILGAMAAGETDPETKARRLRAGWILYVVNFAFVVIGAVLLVVALVLYLSPS